MIPAGISRARSLIWFCILGLYVGCLVVLTGTFDLIGQANQKITFQKGDHVSLIGNGLPERMNHFGYFETLLHDRFPDKQLVVRNIGYSGDVVQESRNLRVKGYPGRDEWLSRMETDVLMVMYGFNESFRGPDGLSDFRKRMDQFVRHVLNRTYNDSSPPRVVLVSPIAFEDLNDPNLPNGARQNRHLQRYTEAIRNVADKHDIPFVDLFSPTKQRYRSADQPLTFNGVHLKEYGYRQLAQILDRKLFGDRGTVSWKELGELRTAVNEKNEYWFDLYHRNDQNDIYGSRSRLSFDGISNREVLQREQERLEQMVANRDPKIWARANGKSYEVTDQNLPDPIPVPEETSGDAPEGGNRYLDGKEAIKKMKLQKGFEVNLFASEERFSELINPAQIRVSPEGRLWVAAWEGYPTYEPPGKKKDKLMVLKDTNDDGVADGRTIFADELKNPTGFHFWNGGVLVTQPPYIVFLKDENGDGKADVKRRLLSHISSADTHHTANSYVWGPGGTLYFQEGVFHRTQIETPYGPVRNRNACVWQFDPETFEVSRYAPYGFGNPHGHDITRWNQGFVTDAPSGRTYHTTLISGYLPFDKTHPNAPDLYGSDPTTAANRILSSRYFPDAYQGYLFTATPQQNNSPRGILMYDLQQNGASYTATGRKTVLESSDLNFRPVDLVVGPDGALYVADWHNKLIDHMNNHIRHPDRDKDHGRIYRITHESGSPSPKRDLTEKSIPELLELLKHPVNSVRARTRVELDRRNREAVSSAVNQWMNSLDPDGTNYEHHMLEALWMHQWLHAPNKQLLNRVLQFDEPRARAAAVRVLTDWRDEIDQPLDFLQEAANDPSALVRLEAVRALSFFPSERSRRIAESVRQNEMDKYLKYALKETLRVFEDR